MKNYNEVKTIEFLPGTDIECAVREAVELANLERCVVKFRFDGQKLRVYTFTDPRRVVEEYWDHHG